MASPARRSGSAVLAAIVLAALAACGSDGPTAAEPADAPSLAAKPAGTVAQVGAKAEGIVYDAVDDIVAVAVNDPSRVLVLDPSTLRVRRSISIPAPARHLAVDIATVLVPDQSSNKLIEIDPATGSSRAIAVGEHPHDAVPLGAGRIVTGNEFAGTLSFVSGTRVTRTVHGLKQPGGTVVEGDTIAVVDVGAFTLSTFDATTGAERATVAAGKGPTHAAAAGPNRVAVADTRGNAVLLFSLSPLKMLASIALPGSPYGVDSDGTDVWVTLTGRNQLVELDASGSALTVQARYPTVRQPNTVAVSPDGTRLWVTGTADGVVQEIRR